MNPIVGCILDEVSAYFGALIIGRVGGALRQRIDHFRNRFALEILLPLDLAPSDARSGSPRNVFVPDELHRAGEACIVAGLNEISGTASGKTNVRRAIGIGGMSVI